MFLKKIFKPKKENLSEIKEIFSLFLENNNIDEAHQYLNKLCKKTKNKCPQYSKVFFNIFKDINTNIAIDSMKPYIEDENDISFLKVYIVRLRKVGEIPLANKLSKKIGVDEVVLKKAELENILAQNNDKKEVIKKLLKELPDQEKKILFNAFSILKDSDTKLAAKYGLRYLELKPNDFKLFNMLKKRIDTISLDSQELDFYNDLNEKINYYNKVKKLLINSDNQYELKKDLKIALRKLNYEKLIEELLEELYSNSVIEKDLIQKMIFNVLKDTEHKDMALRLGHKYLDNNPSDKKFKRSLKKLKFNSDKNYKEKFLEKVRNITLENYLAKNFKNKNFIELLDRIKGFDDIEFDLVIDELKKKYPVKIDDIDKIIFSELKEYDVYRAIRYGKQYLIKNIKDCKFIKVFLKRLERIKNYQEMYDYANKAVGFCDDEEILYIKFKFELKNDLAELETINEPNHKNFIQKLEEKFKDHLELLYRELFSFYKNRNYNKAKEYAKRSLDITYNEYLIKDLYDLHIYYGSLTKAYSVLPNKAKLPTLDTKKKNILSLLSLYENGFDLKVSPVKSYKADNNKILYMLHNRLPYNSGGYATRSHGLLTGVARHGWDIHGVSRLGYPQDKIKNVEINELDIIDGISYHILSQDNIGLGQIPLKEYLEKYAYSLLAFAKKEKPYIIHAASNYMNGVVANYVAKCLGIKSIYEVRGLWELTRISRQPEWENTEYYNLMSKMEAEAAKGADYVFTLTNALKDEMIRRGVDGDKIFILPNGVVTERFSPLTKNIELADKLNIENKIVIGFIGSFVQYEGLEYIVDAIEILVNKGTTDMVALMVGDGAVWQDIVNQVQDKKLEKYFIFTGRIPHNEVEDYYSLVDIAPLPRKGLPVCEMVSPLKPFEAMAMEKVVLSSNVAALAEIVEDGFNGMLFEKDNVKDLADKIEILANDEALRERIGKQARKWVLENRDWKNISEILHQSYKKMKEV